MQNFRLGTTKKGIITTLKWILEKKKRCHVVEWIYMVQMGSKWRAVMRAIINYVFNSNSLHLLSNIQYTYTPYYFMLHFLRHASAVVCPSVTIPSTWRDTWITGFNQNIYSYV